MKQLNFDALREQLKDSQLSLKMAETIYKTQQDLVVQEGREDKLAELFQQHMNNLINIYSDIKAINYLLTLEDAEGV